jgi:hypothetical protein
MSARQLILLSPYRLPAQNPQSLGNDDVAALLNGHSALWHPAALLGAAGPPRIASPYDYEQPSQGQIFAVPETPPLVLPDDWEKRVRESGAVCFRATPDRMATFSNLLAALRNQAEQASKLEPLFALDSDRTAPFLGIGFGFRMIETLFEAMEHENVLSTSDFWLDVQSALAVVTDPEASRKHLQAAADRLLAAREVLYPVNIHLIDIGLLEEKDLGAAFPSSIGKGLACNLVAAAALLEKLGREAPNQLRDLRSKVQAESLEICGGAYVEREDALLPIESQLWNLHKGLAAYKELLGQEIRIFARKRFGVHPQLPLLLQHAGLKRALLIAFDESVLPNYRVTVVNWSSADGKQIDAFTRLPYPADSPQTYFHWAHYLHRTIAQDHAATLALLHRGPAAPWYDELLELSRLGPVLGQWTTLSQYFNDVLAGEYAAASSADEFHGDYLTQRTEAHAEEPIGWLARHVRLRRRVDTAWTWAALYQGLVGSRPQNNESRDIVTGLFGGPLGLDGRSLCDRLSSIEDVVELGSAGIGDSLAEFETEMGGLLAERLLARGQKNNPGYLILNPCSFARRVVVELAGIRGPLELSGPLKNYQTEGGTALAVVEVPALGFAWLPRAGDAGASLPTARMRLADDHAVRNEFFEAEIDGQTGGLRALRDRRTRTNRVGQQLVFNPGSHMRAREIKVTAAGSALGEVVSEGDILDEQENILARFRQRFRAWLGRPVLDLRIEIQPERPPQGYPWHAYYGARFAWRDERATVVRGINGTACVTNHTRPETPDYLEWRLGGQTTTLFVGGLPFHQRHGGRMLDVILVVEGETTRFFDLALGLDREYPMQTALGLISPVTVMPTADGPPHIGAAGWLFHLDAPNLLLTRMWPDPEGKDAILLRLLECQSRSVQAELRCARNPRRAYLVDGHGEMLLEAGISGDAVQFEVAAGDLAQLRVEF